MNILCLISNTIQIAVSLFTDNFTLSSVDYFGKQNQTCRCKSKCVSSAQVSLPGSRLVKLTFRYHLSYIIIVDSLFTYNSKSILEKLIKKVSHTFHIDNNIPSDMNVTHMLTQWGQFLDHDITLTPEEEVHDCCTTRNVSHLNSQCFPIHVDKTDSFYFNQTVNRNVSCLEFSRYEIKIQEKEFLYFSQRKYFSLLFL